jgi:solute carrier family 35 protein E3
MCSWDAEKVKYIKTSLWIVANILTAVGLILTNKVIMSPPFNFVYVFTLTSIHFFVTALTMEIMALAQFFSRSRLSWTSSALMSVACALSVGLMNLSLTFNNLGFYQLCKLLGFPWLVFVQAVVYKIHTTWKIKVSLAIILIGMALATIDYIDMNLQGSIVGLAAVTVTTQFQIWQGQKQHENDMNAMQINHSQALPTFLVCVILALLIEFNSFYRDTSILLHTWTLREVRWIALSAALAAGVNLCSYGLIGNTSTITFQVVGHAKTVLVLIAGYLLSQQQTHIKWINVIGVVITLYGTILYSFLRHSETTGSSHCELLPTKMLQYFFRCADNQHNLVKESSQSVAETNTSKQDASESEGER